MGYRNTIETVYVMERQSDEASNYRQLWLSVLNLVITEAGDFESQTVQRLALQWLFSNNAWQDRSFICDLLGIDFNACAGGIAGRILDRARAYSKLNPRSDEPVLRKYLIRTGLRTPTQNKKISFMDRVTLSNRRDGARTFLQSEWAFRLQRIAR